MEVNKPHGPRIVGKRSAMQMMAKLCGCICLAEHLSQAKHMKICMLIVPALGIFNDSGGAPCNVGDDTVSEMQLNMFVMVARWPATIAVLTQLLLMNLPDHLMILLILLESKVRNGENCCCRGIVW